MNTQTVDVTAEIIERGERLRSQVCPVGLALNEEGALSPNMASRTWYVGQEFAVCRLHQRPRYGFDEELSDAIKRYDRTGAMSPMTLIIDHDAKTITVQT